MKTFDLQAAIAGAPIQDVNGQKLNFVAFASEAKYHEQFVYLDANGNICATSEDTAHIFMTPVVKTYWVNVYNSKFGEPYFGIPYDNEADAMSYVVGVDGYGYLKTISFEVEE